MKISQVVKYVIELHKKQSTAAIVFRRWAEATTAHGFLDLSRAKSQRGNIIWAVLIVISWILMCNQVSRAIGEFARHEWASTVKEISVDTGEEFFHNDLEA
uniref:Uncharacterized protein n=1 Tax=Plectus sambesii TaxID=2011161 RepID=A0A914W8U0_9BILA